MLKISRSKFYLLNMHALQQALQDIKRLEEKIDSTFGVSHSLVCNSPISCICSWAYISVVEQTIFMAYQSSLFYWFVSHCPGSSTSTIVRCCRNAGYDQNFTGSTQLFQGAGRSPGGEAWGRYWLKVAYSTTGEEGIWDEKLIFSSIANVLLQHDVSRIKARVLFQVDLVGWQCEMCSILKVFYTLQGSYKSSNVKNQLK